MGFVADAVSGIGNTVGSLLGTGGGNAGNAGMNFNAQPVDILQGTDLNQVGTAYDQTQSGLQQQQAFTNALMAQNGIQNQANVFGQQQALANQLQGVANGTGPNPALAQLQNTTGQNVANQAALMAGQRGSQANVGLLGRQMAMQGGNLQQQAVGQGAALQSQQQLNAMNALQGQQSSMAGVAGNQIGQQANAVMGFNQASQNQQAQLLNALNQYNSNRVNMQSNVNNANAGIANTTAQGQQKTFGSLSNAAGTAVGKVLPSVTSFFAKGGEVGPQSNIGRFLSGWSSEGMGMQSNAPSAPLAPVSYGSFDSSPLFGSPKAAPSMSDQNSEVADSGNFDSPVMQLQAPGRPSFHFEASGGPIEIPGKAKVSGNSLKNDIVPAMLSPHEIVLPRSVTMSKNAPEKAKQFVAAIMAKKKREGK